MEVAAAFTSAPLGLTSVSWEEWLSIIGVKLIFNFPFGV